MAERRMESSYHSRYERIPSLPLRVGTAGVRKPQMSEERDHRLIWGAVEDVGHWLASFDAADVGEFRGNLARSQRFSPAVHEADQLGEGLGRVCSVERLRAGSPWALDDQGHTVFVGDSVVRSTLLEVELCHQRAPASGEVGCEPGFPAPLVLVG